MAGTIVAGTLSDGTYSGSITDTVRGACKAWVNFNGTGTVAIRASYNVSSITDNGAGSYTVNFTTAMPDVNYTPFASLGLVDSGTSGRGKYAGFNNQSGTVYSPSTTSIRMMVASTADGLTQSDSDFVYVTIFR